MDRTALHLEIRNALNISDELSRDEHYLGDDGLAGSLSALRSALGDLERVVGRSHEDESAPEPTTVEAVERALQALVIRRYDVPRQLHARMEKLLASAERVSIALWDPTERVPSKPVLGMLPVARVVPQDVHSVLDYVNAAGLVASSLVARTATARAVGKVLGVGIAGASAMTDYRLSAAKVIPIEVHETLDYTGGMMAIAAPFVLGYAKKDPIAAAIHVGIGLTTIVTSLLTDYRASKGITWPERSKGGPELGARSGRDRGAREGVGREGVRVSEVQRPLEGLSSAPSVWDSEATMLVQGVESGDERGI